MNVSTTYRASSADIWDLPLTKYTHWRTGGGVVSHTFPLCITCKKGELPYDVLSVYILMGSFTKLLILYYKELSACISHYMKLGL